VTIVGALRAGKSSWHSQTSVSLEFGPEARDQEAQAAGCYGKSAVLQQQFVFAATTIRRGMGIYHSLVGNQL